MSRDFLQVVDTSLTLDFRYQCITSQRHTIQPLTETSHYGRVRYTLHNWLFSAVAVATTAVEGRIGQCAVSRKLVVIGRCQWTSISMSPPSELNMQHACMCAITPIVMLWGQRRGQNSQSLATCQSLQNFALPP